MTSDEICQKLAAWADVADIQRSVNQEIPRAGEEIGHVWVQGGDTVSGALVIQKSDLLYRLIYGGEKGPSQTLCPTHQGRWTGIHYPPPTCGCADHRGSSATTGWLPDKHCGCIDGNDDG